MSSRYRTVKLYIILAVRHAAPYGCTDDGSVIVVTDSDGSETERRIFHK